MTIELENIQLLAKQCGIDAIGAAPVERLDNEAERLFDWIDKRFHGEMSWIAREPEKRSDPRLIFPEAKTVLVAAVNYFTPHTHKTDGKISRYAWGDDYHDVVKERLRSLLSLIKEEFPEADGKICVDTAPMMEKAWGVRSGLGWIGKHTNLITREMGSWVFLGEILLNKEVSGSLPPVADHCGTCTACLDACPTAAIVSPYVVDSRKCISYATIELRSETLPNEIAKDLNGWLYGCDICQDVCPWNRFETPSNETRFEPRHGETSLDPESVLEMDHQQYVERFRHSSMKRTKLSGLKRNAKHLKDNYSRDEAKTYET